MKARNCIKLKRKQLNNSGVAMIFAVIVGVVVMVFCLYLLLVTYTLYAQSSRQTTRTQCKLFAQSFQESFGQELNDENSSLNKYLAQCINDGEWISEEEAMATPSSELGTKVSEMKLDMSQDVVSSYKLMVTLSYGINESDDEEESTEDEKDDQDEDLNPDKPGENLPGEPSGDLPGEAPGTPGNGSYTVHAKITCVRDGLDASDVQSYTIEAEYPTVSLSRS